MDAQAIGLDANRPSSVDVPLPPLNSVNSRGQLGTSTLPRDENSVLQIIDRLAEYGAQGIPHWVTMPDSRIVGRVYRPQATDELRRHEQRVVGDVLRNEKTETRILPASSPSLMVGAPCWGLSGHVLTVNFPITDAHDRQEFIRQRQEIVEMAVSLVERVDCRPPKHPAQNHQSQWKRFRRCIQR